MDVSKDGLNLKEDTEQIKQIEEDFKPLIEYMQEILSDKVRLINGQCEEKVADNGADLQGDHLCAFGADARRHCGRSTRLLAQHGARDACTGAA